VLLFPVVCVGAVGFPKNPGDVIVIANAVLAAFVELSPAVAVGTSGFDPVKSFVAPVQVLLNAVEANTCGMLVGDADMNP
jgi:hypothetical protein